MPIPVRMNPICDMEEHASVRFRLTENRARRAPRNMVMVPRTSTIHPKTAFSRYTSTVVIRIP